MSDFEVSPGARAIYQEALDRAASRSFLGWQLSSAAEAERRIDQVFALAAIAEDISGTAAAVRDDCDSNPDEVTVLASLAAGRAVSSGLPVLSEAEARLAAAALDIADGDNDLTAAAEAAEALSHLTATLSQMALAPIHHEDYAAWLTRASADRGRGWRRISNSVAAREIRGIYNADHVAGLDGTAGLGPLDAAFVYYSLNYFAGTGDIELGDIWTASDAIERALRRFASGA